jgi:hypothetical protein
MKIENFPAESPIHVAIGTVVKFMVTSEGRLRIIKNPMPGHKLSVRSLSSQVAVVVDEYGDDLYVQDVLQVGNVHSLDALTRECLRSFRAETGILLNPLMVMAGRTPLAVPEGVKCIFWAYHR